MTDLSLIDFVTQLTPLIQPVVDVIITGVITLGVMEVKKYTGMQISSDAQATFVDEIEKFANIEVAKAADNMATGTIHITNPIVGNIAAHAMAAVPKIVMDLGITPQRAQEMAQAALGRLQADMTANPVAPAPAPAAEPPVPAPVPAPAIAAVQEGHEHA